MNPEKAFRILRYFFLICGLTTPWLVTFISEYRGIEKTKTIEQQKSDIKTLEIRNNYLQAKFDEILKNGK